MLHRRTDNIHKINNYKNDTTKNSLKKSRLNTALLTASMTLLTATITSCTSLSAQQTNYQDNMSAIQAPLNEKSEAWFEAGALKVAQNEAEINKIISESKQTTIDQGKAKNIILFIGDGMGVSTVTAARILEGQNKGNSGEENLLSFETLPYTGLIKTYNTNQQTPDSAGTATAMLTGVKTKAGVLGITDRANRATCTGFEGEKNAELVTALELASMAGKATGIVTTARLTHATPAAAYAKTSERNWESDDKLSDEAKRGGCKDIATQFVESPYVDVAFGGGRRHFIDKSSTDLEGKTGKRQDNTDLTQVWQQNTGGVLVQNKAQFDAIPNHAKKVLGLFNSSHMQYEADRHNDKSGEPSLTQMTTKAIDLLNQDEDGFFMLVESGRIDHGHHAGSAYNALTDTIEFSNAVEAAMRKTSPEDTLIIVTADHSHVLTLAGYPTRGNPILGKVVGNDKYGEPKTTPDLAMDNKPYTTLSYANGLGHHDLGDETNADVVYDNDAVSGRDAHDLHAVDTLRSGFHQEALVPLKSETHAAEDVAIYARGPGARLVSSTSEQNEIFHIMDYAGNLTNLARSKTLANKAAAN